MPSGLPHFVQTRLPEQSDITINRGTASKVRMETIPVLKMYGRLSDELNRLFELEFDVCPRCGGKMYEHTPAHVTLTHTPWLMGYTEVEIECRRKRCVECHKTVQQQIPFKHEKHFITTLAAKQVMLSMRRTHVCKATALETGVNRNVVKAIHKEALIRTLLDENKRPKLPDHPVRYLGVDEWLLQHGNRYATTIIDLETGEILWIEETKKKEVIRHFMDHAGDKFMRGIRGIASDMNADFGTAFQERYPHIMIVYDRFHLIKYFNEQVVNKVRLDKIRELEAAGRFDEATQLKRHKRLLWAKRDTIIEMQASAAAVIAAGGVVDGPTTSLFQSPKQGYTPTARQLQVYEELRADNKEIDDLDTVKGQLQYAYEQCGTEASMLEVMQYIIDYSNGTRNKHFMKFARLLSRNIDGIVSYAKHHITSAKCEGTVNLIKSIRRGCYGLNDHDYLFLRLMDASRGYIA